MSYKTEMIDLTIPIILVLIMNRTVIAQNTTFLVSDNDGMSTSGSDQPSSSLESLSTTSAIEPSQTRSSSRSTVSTLSTNIISLSSFTSSPQLQETPSSAGGIAAQVTTSFPSSLSSLEGTTLSVPSSQISSTLSLLERTTVSVSSSQISSIPSSGNSNSVNSYGTTIISTTNELSDSSVYVNSQIISMSNSSFYDYTTSTPDRSRDFNTSSDSVFLSRSSYLVSTSTSMYSIAEGTGSASVATVGQMSSQEANSAPVSDLKSSTSLYSSYSEIINTQGISSTYKSSLNGLTSDQISHSTNFILSPSSEYTLPGTSFGTTLHGTKTLQTSGLDSSLKTSELPLSSSYGTIQTTSYSSSGHPLSSTTTPPGVTSAFDSMSSSSVVTTANPYLAELQRQIDELKQVESSYRTAVIVLALVITLLLVLIGLYIYRRRRYFKQKQERLGGAIDDDLLEDKAHLRNKPYFDTNLGSANLRLSGRVSTASIGEDKGENEPMNLLKSFNRAKSTQDDVSEEVFINHEDENGSDEKLPNRDSLGQKDVRL